MRIGIVGHESAKFTAITEPLARETIRSVIAPGDVVISGRCPLGGIDIWAIEEAEAMGLETVEYPPARNTWEGGYKQRNIQIARDSDIVICINVKVLPDSYFGMRFGSCYHCHTDTHVKSGGCWTAKYAQRLGKHALWFEL